MKADHAKVSRLLKTARGQIDGILKMVDEDQYCMDISNQLLSAIAILQKTNQTVLAAHIKSCVLDAVKEGKEEEKLDEMLKLFEKLNH